MAQEEEKEAQNLQELRQEPQTEQEDNKVATPLTPSEDKTAAARNTVVIPHTAVLSSRHAQKQSVLVFSFFTDCSPGRKRQKTSG